MSHVEKRDFLLGDEAGATVEIRMDEAEVKLPRRKFSLRDSGVAWALISQIPCLRPAELARPTIAEHWLADGEEIEVLGTIERVVGPATGSAAARSPDPTRADLHPRPAAHRAARPRALTAGSLHAMRHRVEGRGRGEAR